MKIRIPGYLLVILLAFTVVRCAKKGMPEGGPVDKDPPKFIRANPENYSIHFDARQIRIYFDEYIKLDKPQQQIIISPPMDPKPNIMPLGTARKDIKIEIFDTLEKNTTYTINFGKSIIDNNEGNSNNYFKYVFSTGDYIDSLSVSGKVKDASLKAPPAPVSIFLYELDSTYTDSAVYKKTPRYVTYSKDSTYTFNLENLKEGTYKMVAIIDKNNNYLYNPKSEKIGFVAEPITIPTDSTYEITVFKEKLPFKPKRPSQVKGHQILFGYEGSTELDSLKINLLNNKPPDYEYRITKVKDKDSVNYWYNIKPEIDSLSFEVVTPTTLDTVWARIAKLERDSLKVTAEPSGSIGIKEDLKFTANTPISAYQPELIKILDKDSADVPFTAKFLPIRNELQISFNKTTENNYQVTALPGAIEDLFKATNDTIKKNFKTKGPSDYGRIVATIPNIRSYPVIVQLTSTKGQVLAEKYAESGNTFEFPYLTPGDFLLRVIYDKNGNKEWDTGDFLKKKQPEIIKYYSDTLNVRANWDVNETINLD
ncbi:hypothetical protein C7S20_04300 [Christiangramia fulva]|uniref:SbsA Ig-like domain-containing protein n=1 Tax=Christiangramia fulva TaxID=2126553 RepID=A0A2R3Z2S0_9FLAO|nr:Ig-like domain-containing protein [Christiangramia fulva]AVR44547.1 hypothetical protein C7S20_04300 [Christiangramia fulva]